jgi:hypothetical protein
MSTTQKKLSLIFTGNLLTQIKSYTKNRVIEKTHRPSTSQVNSGEKRKQTYTIRRIFQNDPYTEAELPTLNHG